ncbi:DedA family protein [Actinacidiphila soli]|uniref:DedA family protein n=1 Tax=Actinacidiphila soli TaxID=2487275 RepID=UPI000FCC3564|nr:DedA family protein [Actinacidiphila soli]
MIPAGFVESIGVWAYVLVFVLTMAETSVFIGLVLPGETLVLIAAAIAGAGHLDVIGLGTVVITGSIVGDSVGYWVGRWSVHSRTAERMRRRTARWRLARRLRDLSVLRTGRQRAHDFLLRHGGTAVFTGRFVGFVRSFLPFAAGAAGMPYRRFLPSTVAAALIWGTGSVLVGYFLGAAAGGLLNNVAITAVVGVAAVAAVVFTGHRFRRNRNRGRIPGSSVVASSVPSPARPGDRDESLPGAR